jgi:hypothetical protein
VLCLYAGGFLLLAAVLGLSLVLPAWMAALSVGVLLSLLAAILIGKGRTRLRDVHLQAGENTAIIKEDIQWLKNQTR